MNNHEAPFGLELMAERESLVHLLKSFMKEDRNIQLLTHTTRADVNYTMALLVTKFKALIILTK